MKDALGHGSNARGGSPVKDFLVRKQARYAQANAKIEEAGAMLKEITAAMKAATKAGASVYPGWDSGAHEHARRAVGAAGLAHNSLKQGNDYKHDANMADVDSHLRLARGRIDAFKTRYNK